MSPAVRDKGRPVADARLIAAVKRFLRLLGTMRDSGRTVPVSILDAMNDARALLARIKGQK